MTEKEIINRNIELIFDFTREIIKNPSLAEQLPDNCEIEFIDENFPITNEKKIGKYVLKVKNTFEPVNITDSAEDCKGRE